MHNAGTASYTDKADTKVVKFLFPYLWPKGEGKIKTRVVISILAVILSKIAAVWVPFFYKKAVDIFDQANTQLIVVPVFFLIAYGFSRGLSISLLEIKEAVFARVEQQVIRKVALKVFAHLHALSLRFHLDRKTGSVTRSLERGTKAIETFFRFSTFSLIPTALEILLVVFTVLYFYGWIFCVLIASSMFLYIYYTLKITGWRATFLRHMNEADNKSNDRSIESLINYETVKYFGNETYEYTLYDQAQKAYENAAVKNKIGLAILNSGQGLIISLGLIVTMLISGHKVANHELTLGDFVLLNTYLIQLFQPLLILGFAYREIKRSLVEMEHLFGILNVQIDIQDAPDAVDFSLIKGEIVFNQVSFSYNPDRQILKNVSFTVPAGKKVAIVGASGAGKSTIGRLLYRFYDVTEGSILLDGVDIKAMTQKSLRTHIGVVPQDTVLFNENIFYNILYGRPTASKEEVEKAAAMANLTPFIEKLPDGYKTTVGERGLKLSGGEKQRVAIARALLKHPKIFLLDEATSSLDTRTEKQIQDNLNRISKDHTTLAIAHRLSTIVDAHNIIVLENGEIVEQGTHKALLEKKGCYYHMWQKQSQEHDPEHGDDEKV
jgi:ABC-type transport system involved in Fe-S cluster assembly fused permease/ATPase subunit